MGPLVTSGKPPDQPAMVFAVAAPLSFFPSAKPQRNQRDRREVVQEPACLKDHDMLENDLSC